MAGFLLELVDMVPRMEGTWPSLCECGNSLAKVNGDMFLHGLEYDLDFLTTARPCDTPLGLQPYPQKVVRPPKPTPTTFSGGGWSPRDLQYNFFQRAHLRSCEEEFKAKQQARAALWREIWVLSPACWNTDAYSCQSKLVGIF